MRRVLKCGADISEFDEDDVSESETITESAQSKGTISQTSSFSTALRICGMIDLIAGIIGGIAVWDNAPTSYKGGSGFYMEFALGLAFQGLVFFVLFNVIADMADDLRTIRRNQLATHED